MTRKQKPASKETLRVVNRAIAKFEKWKWSDRKVRELPPAEIEEKFAEGAKTHPAANEQAFQWAHAAVRWCIGIDTLAASVAGRAPGLSANPFAIIHLSKLIRGRAERERERDENGKRNPLSPSATMGPFLEAAWSKKDQNDNLTGVHYIILMLLWGCRKSEHARCRWGELLAPSERKVVSYVLLDDGSDLGPRVFFHKTKNGGNHLLPIAPMAAELLRRRQAAAAADAAERGFDSKARPFVFPARNKRSATGFYSDCTALLNAIRDEAGIERCWRRPKTEPLMRAVPI